MVTARFLPHLGGTEVHTYELATRLVARGIDVTVLATEVDGARVGTDSSYGFPVIRVKGWPERQDWYAAPDIPRIIAKKAWDLIHVQGIHTLVLPLAIVAARRARLPYVITLHSGGHSSGVRRWIRRLVWLVVARAIRRASRVIAVSEFERATFAATLGLPDSTMTVIQSGVDLPEAAPGEQATYDAPGKPLIVSLGRLVPYKGHDRIIRALPEVAEQFPSVQLVIVGTGPDDRRLRKVAREAGVSDRISLTAIPTERRSELRALLDRADLVVALSEYESQGLAAMEAAAAGCSVLVADSTALHELVRAGLARGVGVVTRDALAAAVVDQLRRPHAPSGHITTWEECAAQTHALYLAVLR